MTEQLAKPIPETRLIAIRDWKEPWYSTGVHVPASEMACLAAELLASRAKVRELEQALQQIKLLWGKELDAMKMYKIADAALDRSVLHVADKAAKP
jgi:hypothetical protein